MHPIVNGVKPHGPRIASVRGYVSGQRASTIGRKVSAADACVDEARRLGATAGMDLEI